MSTAARPIPLPPAWLVPLLLTLGCQPPPEQGQPGMPSPPDGWRVPRSDTPAEGPFRRAHFLPLGRDGGHKAVPLLGSFDGDGHLDVVANPRLVGFQLHASQGGGAFRPPTTIAPGIAGGWGGDVGDIDGDGHLDVAFGDHVSGARVFLGHGGGGFRDSSPPREDRAAFSGGGLGDINGDGRLDFIAGADQFGLGLRVYLGDGKGGWSVATPAGLPPYGDGDPEAGGFTNIGQIVLADADGDGDPDLFAFGQLLGVQFRQGGIVAWVYRNEGGGARWTRMAEAEGGTPSAVGNPVQGAVGDVNGDALPDLAVGGTIYLNEGGRRFVRAVTVDGAHISRLADMDGDGLVDLVTHQADQGLRLYRGDGTGGAFVLDGASGLPDGGTWPAEAPVQGMATDAYGIGIGDLDGNGRLDVVRIVAAQQGGGFTARRAVYLEAWVR